MVEQVSESVVVVVPGSVVVVVPGLQQQLPMLQLYPLWHVPPLDVH
jgi:hypothetical protein